MSDLFFGFFFRFTRYSKFFLNFTQGLGLVITGTMPVFNQTRDPFSSQVRASQIQRNVYAETGAAAAGGFQVFVVRLLVHQSVYDDQLLLLRATPPP